MKLPEDWRWVRLGEVCEFIYGASLPTRLRQPGKVPVYGSNGVVGYHNQPLTNGPTIVIGRKGSIGEVHFSPVACWPIDTTYYIEHPRLDADLEWLTHWLRALNLSEMNKAAAIPGLNRDDAYSLEIPLPPLAEQQRIAAILNEQMTAVERARAAAEAQLEAAKSLPAAYLRAVFNNPEAQLWPIKKFEEVAILQRGYDLPSQDQVPGKYPIMTSSGMHGRHSEFRAKRPGVITGRSGSIGKVYFVDEDYWPHNTALYVKDFRGNEPKYVFFLLQWLDLEAICSGSGVPTLDRKEVHKVSVSHPDRETQIRIAAILTDQMTAVEQTQKALKGQLDLINRLPEALLKSAFSGTI